VTQALEMMKWALLTINIKKKKWHKHWRWWSEPCWQWSSIGRKAVRLVDGWWQQSDSCNGNQWLVHCNGWRIWLPTMTTRALLIWCVSWVKCCIFSNIQLGTLRAKWVIFYSLKLGHNNKPDQRSHLHENAPETTDQHD